MRSSLEPPTWAGLALLLLMGGCETAGVDGGAPARSRETPPPAVAETAAARADKSACRGLDPEACGRTPGCALLWGWEPAAYCTGEADGDSRRVVGCHPAGEACPEEETCGVREGAPELLVFPNRCLPAGWTRRPMTECCGEPAGEPQPSDP